MDMWPIEYEGMRAEAREAAMAIQAAIRGGIGVGEVPADLAGRVAAARNMMKAWEQTSPAGTDEVLAGVPCRVFRPAGEARGTYLHFHGGAMYVGSPRMNDLANAEVSARLGVTAVSVDYRLAPEHPFPAGGDDCLAVARWVLEHETGLVVLGGESAGAYFAAVTVLRIRDELGAIERVSGANLVFGVYDLSGTPSNRGVRPSDVPDLIDVTTGEMVLRCFVPGRSLEEAKDPSISPMYARLHDLPPALFTVGSADHLLDDSLFMAAGWLAWGCGAERAVYPDCIPGWVGFPFERATRAEARIADFLQECF